MVEWVLAEAVLGRVAVLALLPAGVVVHGLRYFGARASVYEQRPHRISAVVEANNIGRGLSLHSIILINSYLN